jgi:predicted Zn-dependent peptidase
VLADAVESLDEAEVGRARAQLEAGLLMGLETPQGRADTMARSIEVFGRILPVDELLGQIRAVDAAAARAAGAALLDGRAAVASVGAQLALAA